MPRSSSWAEASGSRRVFSHVGGLDGGGGPALLKLRIVLSNGHFKAYGGYHMQRKHPRVHAVRYHYALELAA